MLKLKLPVILLSAGKGSRVGVSKGLVTYGGRPWITWQWEALTSLGLGPLVVVLGHQAIDYLALLPELDTALVAVNPDPERGPFSSLQEGARKLFENETASTVAVLPIDVPVPDENVWRALRHARRGKIVAALPTFRGKGGHPVLLSSEFLRGLLSIVPTAPEARLDVQIRRLAPQSVRRVAVEDARVVANLNTPEAFVRLAEER